MSMTREEAIKHLRNDWFMSLGGQLCVDEDKKDAFLEAVGMGVKALRPVSREQVEKAWRGEWVRTHSTDNFWTEVWKCSYCGFEDDNGDCFDFCPECGQPKTDEAVEMVMKRLEALNENIHND